MLKKLPFKKIKSRALIEGIPGNWFLKHFASVVLVVVLALTYISVRFDCVTSMETVQQLTRKLEVTRTEVQRERSSYMSRTCESSMQQMVDSLKLGLSIQERPPYKISLP